MQKLKVMVTSLILLHNINFKGAGLNLRSLKKNKTEFFYPQYKILQGRMVTIWKYPFMVSLQRSKILTRAWCGGTILAENWILTAAHCVVHKMSGQLYNPDELIVVAGFTNIRNLKRVEYIYRIKAIFCHPRFNESYLFNDVALIKIKSKFNLRAPNLATRVVNLIDPKILQGRPIEEVFINCLAIGWGQTAYKGRFSDILREVNLPLISYWLCRRLISNVVRPSNVCTYDAKYHSDACHGDSGGPLMCESDNGSVQIAITSWGRGCGLMNSPGVWTRVDVYHTWIKKVLSGGKDARISTAHQIKPFCLHFIFVCLLIYFIVRL